MRVAQVAPPAEWRAIVVLPAEPLATSKARAVLPASLSARAMWWRIFSRWRCSGLAFAQGAGDLLRTAMSDRIHQPYRAPICPLLPLLLPLVGEHGILGAALSGAGPAVLVIVEERRAWSGLRRQSAGHSKARGRRSCWSAAFEGSGQTKLLNNSVQCEICGDFK